MGKQSSAVVTATATIVATPVKLVGIAVTITDAGGSLILKDGGSGGTTKFTMQSDAGIYIPMEIEFTTDLHGTNSGTGTYILIYQ